MPSQIIHVLSGSRALRRRELPVAGVIPEIFNLGCQGPDIFSHNRRTRPFALAFSRLLHRHDYGRFCARFARQVIGDSGAPVDPAAASWLYGFVTHQIADRVMHPYIVYRSWVAGSTGIAGVPPDRFHVFLERVLDVLLYERLEDRSVSSFDCLKFFAVDQATLLNLSRPIALALAETYPLENDNASDLELRVQNAFSDTLYFYRLTNPSDVTLAAPPDEIRQALFPGFDVSDAALLHPVGLDASVDWLNDANGLWLDPVSGLECRLSVSDLFQRIVEEAAAAIGAAEKVLAGIEAPDSLEAAFGNGPLSISGPDGKIGTVNHASPFELGPVLLDQAERRRAWLSL
jgi:hypothetical protein